MESKPREELMSSLKELFIDGTYSDITVTCGSDRHKVHKAVICPRSKFFASAFGGSFKEADTGVLDLPEDDPEAVKMMMHYFYHLDYPQVTPKVAEPESTALLPISETQSIEPESTEFVAAAETLESLLPKKDKKKKKRISTLSSTSTQHSNLLIHAKVYILGEKYGMSGLKDLALGKFEKDVAIHWDKEDFLFAVEEVYTSIIQHDRSLRDVVLRTMTQHAQLLDKGEVQDLVKSLEDLCFDLLMYYHKNRGRSYGW